MNFDDMFRGFGTIPEHDRRQCVQRYT